MSTEQGIAVIVFGKSCIPVVALTVGFWLCWRIRRGGCQGCMRREGTPEPAPAAVTQAVGGGWQSGWGRVPSVTNAIEAGPWCQEDSGWA